ncbi:unnamed protein product [Closterium sp. Yama58-4]|nr:unnamed protein product [Closterium sp. Yama58-4]
MLCKTCERSESNYLCHVISAFSLAIAGLHFTHQVSRQIGWTKYRDVDYTDWNTDDAYDTEAIDAEGEAREGPGVSEERMLQRLVERLESTPLTASPRHVSRAVRSAGVRLSPRRVTLAARLLASRGSWRRALLLVHWAARRDQSRIDRKVLTSLIAALGWRYPDAVLQAMRLMMAQKPMRPPQPAHVCAWLNEPTHILSAFPIPTPLPSPHPHSSPLPPSPILSPPPIPNPLPSPHPHSSPLPASHQLLNACGAKRQWKGVQWVLQQMRSEGVAPDAATFGLAIQALSLCSQTHLALQVLADMEAAGFPPTVQTYRDLVRALAAAGRVEEAEAAVREMQERGMEGNAGVFHSLACALCSVGRWQDAVALVEKISRAEDAQPPVVTWTGLIRACERSSRLDDAARVFREMQVRGCTPNITTCNIMITVFARTGRFAAAEEIYAAARAGEVGEEESEGRAREEEEEEEEEEDEVEAVGEAMTSVGQISKDGQKEEQNREESGENERDADDEGDEGEKVWMGRRREDPPLVPNSHTFSAMLGACVRCRQWQAVRQVARDMQRQGWALHVRQHGWVVDALLKGKQAAIADELLIAMRGGSQSHTPAESQSRGAVEREGVTAAGDSGAGSSSQESSRVSSGILGSSRESSRDRAGLSGQDYGSVGQEESSPGVDGSMGGEEQRKVAARQQLELLSALTVLLRVRELLESHAPLDGFAWRYAVASVGGGLTGVEVEETVGVMDAWGRAVEGRALEGRALEGRLDERVVEGEVVSGEGISWAVAGADSAGVESGCDELLGVESAGTQGGPKRGADARTAADTAASGSDAGGAVGAAGAAVAAGDPGATGAADASAASDVITEAYPASSPAVDPGVLADLVRGLLIGGKREEVQIAMRLVDRMEREGWVADAGIYTSLLHRIIRLGMGAEAREVLARAEAAGVKVEFDELELNDSGGAMAAAEFEICENCARPIPVANLPLHTAHCETRLVRCDGCDEMVATAAMDQHMAAVHAPAPCSLCGEPMERRLLPEHEASACPLRSLICAFCDLPVTAMDLQSHTDVCGSRTDRCEICSKYVLKRDQEAHQQQHLLQPSPHNAATPSASRDGTGAGSSRNAREPLSVSNGLSGRSPGSAARGGASDGAGGSGGISSVAASGERLMTRQKTAVLASSHGDNNGASSDYSGGDTTNGNSGARSDGNRGSNKKATASSAHAASSPSVGSSPEASFLGPVGEMLQRNKAKTAELLGKLQSFGVAGVLSYGLFNTVYYIFAFLFVFLYVAPSPRGLGLAAAAKNFLKVFAVVWAGSQVTKLVRAGGALMLAPFMERGIAALSSSTGVFKSRGQAVAALVAFCFGLAGVLFLSVTALWA